MYYQRSVQNFIDIRIVIIGLIILISLCQVNDKFKNKIKKVCYIKAKL